MEKANLDDQSYELFYLELPHTAHHAEYFEDIEIQDEYDDQADDKRGLSDKQVSEIAQDSLNAAQNRPSRSRSSNPQLFPSESPPAEVHE